jgi:hypothetical protein
MFGIKSRQKLARAEMALREAMARHQEYLVATGDAVAFAMAQQRTAQAEERLSELKAMLEDMRSGRHRCDAAIRRSDRDAWRDQANGQASRG